MDACDLILFLKVKQGQVCLFSSPLLSSLELSDTQSL